MLPRCAAALLSYVRICICVLTAAAELGQRRGLHAQLPNCVAKAHSRAMAALVNGCCALAAAAEPKCAHGVPAQLPNGVAKARSRAMAALVDGLAGRARAPGGHAPARGGGRARGRRPQPGRAHQVLCAGAASRPELAFTWIFPSSGAAC